MMAPCNMTLKWIMPHYAVVPFVTPHEICVITTATPTHRKVRYNHEALPENSLYKWTQCPKILNANFNDKFFDQLILIFENTFAASLKSYKK